MMAIPRVWELIGDFKDECLLRGWKTSENEDWIKADSEFHNFLWVRNIHQSTFEKITTASKCAIKQGISYEVVNVDYTAWLFPDAPSKRLIYTVARNPKLAKTIAIYDLSDVYAGKSVCFKFNETNSDVFQEFENFLEQKWGVEFRPLLSSLTKEA